MVDRLHRTAMRANGGRRVAGSVDGRTAGKGRIWTEQMQIWSGWRSRGASRTGGDVDDDDDGSPLDDEQVLGMMPLRRGRVSTPRADGQIAGAR
ncbi:hypothetical protein ACLOJK_020187 [Asimina triloba]